jgi:hypothetical protein
MRGAEAPSRLELVCVGVARALVCWARVNGDADGLNGRAWTSASSESCHVVNEGCSRHSYIRRWLSEEMEACMALVDMKNELNINALILNQSGEAQIPRPAQFLAPQVGRRAQSTAR